MSLTLQGVDRVREGVAAALDAAQLAEGSPERRQKEAALWKKAKGYLEGMAASISILVVRSVAPGPLS